MSLAVLLIPIASALACAAVILTLLRRPDLLPIDRPNERSLHAVPVPRIGGLGIVAGVLVAFALLRATPVLALPSRGSPSSPSSTTGRTCRSRSASARTRRRRSRSRS